LTHAQQKQKKSGCQNGRTSEAGIPLETTRKKVTPISKVSAAIGEAGSRHTWGLAGILRPGAGNWKKSSEAGITAILSGQSL